MKLIHFGHAALLVETNANKILFDPGVFGDGWKESENLTAIVITHAHADHLDAEGIAELRSAQPELRILAQEEAVESLKLLGVVAETFAPGDEVMLGSDHLRAVGGQHARIHEDLGTSGNVGIVLESNGTRFFHPGDDLSAVPEGIDILALPLSAPWGSLKDTVEFLRAISPSRVIPIHDALLSELGRKIFLARIGALAPRGAEFVPTAIGVPFTVQ
jgi:L-ascorbate metabolism protein UlaG (beta-lactamase superfamily)